MAGRGETLNVIPRYLITGRRICGSSFGGVKGRDQVPQLVQLYLDGQIDVDPFISHTITLDDVNHGFELMERQDGIRSVIDVQLSASHPRQLGRPGRGAGPTAAGIWVIVRSLVRSLGRRAVCELPGYHSGDRVPQSSVGESEEFPSTPRSVTRRVIDGDDGRLGTCRP